MPGALIAVPFLLGLLGLVYLCFEAYITLMLRWLRFTVATWTGIFLSHVGMRW